MESLIKNILKNENITPKTITKATSGFTNLVYFVNDDMVIKLSQDSNTKTLLEKETLLYKNFTIKNIPKYISSGDFGDYKYLIISKIEGKALYSIWHTFTQEERIRCVKKIAKILKEFNSQDYEFLSENYMEFNWIQYITNELKNKSNLLKEMNYNTTKLDQFITKELPYLYSENKFGLVYNDAHFDNFIYNNGKLSLIDFDRVRVCPIDYEMLIFKTMCDMPWKFANEEDEENVIIADYAEIYETFKKEYPEMFANPNVEKRIKIYQFNYCVDQAIKIKDENWIKELLSGCDFYVEAIKQNNF